jgi:hypothetical protein
VIAHGSSLGIPKQQPCSKHPILATAYNRHAGATIVSRVGNGRILSAQRQRDMPAHPPATIPKMLFGPLTDKVDSDGITPSIKSLDRRPSTRPPVSPATQARNEWKIGKPLVANRKNATIRLASITPAQRTLGATTIRSDCIFHQAPGRSLGSSGRYVAADPARRI